MTVLIWTQHLLGSGHLRRALALAGALAQRRVGTVLVTGGAKTNFPTPPGVQVVQLDPVHAASGDFADLRGADDRPWSRAAAAARARELQTLAHQLRPTVLVTELFPFGRNAFREELLPLIDMVRSAGGRVVCSVRDILVDRHPAKTLVMRDLALARYDRILVHGDQRFLPFAASFPHADELAGRTVHTGFVVDRTTAPAARRQGILVSAGGGRVGARLLDVAAAAAGVMSGDPWHLVGGTGLVEPDRRRLETTLGSAGRVDTHLNDLPERLASCRLSVSQAGYNTIAEALMGAAPMVLVPFAEAGETEQLRRAQRLAELGRAVLLPSHLLSTSSLQAAVEQALVQDTAIGRDFAFDGATVSAGLIRDLIP